jgi:hypothetical protein
LETIFNVVYEEALAAPGFWLQTFGQRSDENDFF